MIIKIQDTDYMILSENGIVKYLFEAGKDVVEGYMTEEKAYEMLVAGCPVPDELYEKSFIKLNRFYFPAMTVVPTEHVEEPMEEPKPRPRKRK